MGNKIYTITCFTKLERDELGWPELGSTAFMGYYFDREAALDAVRNNACDINETIYNYAVVEAYEEGLYQPPLERQFFEFDREDGLYHEMEEPDMLRHIAGII